MGEELNGLIEIAEALQVSYGHLHGLLKRGKIRIPRRTFGVRSYYLPREEVPRVQKELEAHKASLKRRLH